MFHGYPGIPQDSLQLGFRYTNYLFLILIQPSWKTKTEALEAVQKNPRLLTIPAFEHETRC